MPRQERTGDHTIGGRMDEDELLAIATEEGFGDEDEVPRKDEPRKA